MEENKVVIARKAFLKENDKGGQKLNEERESGRKEINERTNQERPKKGANRKSGFSDSLSNDQNN